MILASLCDTPLGRVLIDSQNDPQYWIKVKKQKQHDDIWYMLEHLSLVNSNQIKKFNNDCDNQPEEDKERLLKRSYEVLRNPLKGFADANYAKFIKINDDYYVIKNISNIYDIIFQKDEKNKKLFDKLFDTNNKTVMLLCEKNDTKLFEKLKKIYSQYKNSINPFKEYCLFEKGIEAQNVKFEYLIH